MTAVPAFHGTERRKCDNPSKAFGGGLLSQDYPMAGRGRLSPTPPYAAGAARGRASASRLQAALKVRNAERWDLSVIGLSGCFGTGDAITDTHKITSGQKSQTDLPGRRGSHLPPSLVNLTEPKHGHMV